MRKIIFIVLCLLPSVSFAQAFPSDTQTYFDTNQNYGGASPVLILATSTRTILSVQASPQGTGAYFDLYCGYPDVLSYSNLLIEQYISVTPWDAQSVLHCDKALYLWGSSLTGTLYDINVLYVDRDTSKTSDPMSSLNIHEQLTVAGVIIFFLAILCWPTFFRMFRKIDDV